MRWIEFEIRSPDAVLLAVGIDPLPEGFRRSPALRPIGAVDADDIGRQPAAIAAAKAAAVVRPVARRLQAAGDTLTVVVAKRAGDAGLQSGGLGGVKRVKQLQLEAAIHAADHVIHHRHAGAFGRAGILPGEIVFDQFGEASGDGHHLALALDLHLALLSLLDGVFLRRPLVERPQELVDAGLRHHALADQLDAAPGRRHDVLRRRVGRHRRWHGRCLGGRNSPGQDFRRIAQRGQHERARRRFGGRRCIGGGPGVGRGHRHQFGGGCDLRRIGNGMLVRRQWSLRWLAAGRSSAQPSRWPAAPWRFRYWR